MCSVEQLIQQNDHVYTSRQMSRLNSDQSQFKRKIMESVLISFDHTSYLKYLVILEAMITDNSIF